MPEKLSYILDLRNALQPERRNMPLFQNGSAIIIVDAEGRILLQERVDRNQWCVTGGLQELGETFEEVAVREAYEETGLVIQPEDLLLLGIVSGESRKNSYPNGDVVYNNTALYVAHRFEGTIAADHEEIVDVGGSHFPQKESKRLQFFAPDALPDNLMDCDLIEVYIKSLIQL